MSRLDRFKYSGRKEVIFKCSLKGIVESFKNVSNYTLLYNTDFALNSDYVAAEFSCFILNSLFVRILKKIDGCLPDGDDCASFGFLSIIRKSFGSIVRGR